MSDSKPPFDLDRLTVPELAALIEAAQAKRQEKMEGAKTALLAEFKDKAAELGLSLKAPGMAAGNESTLVALSRPRHVPFRPRIAASSQSSTDTSA